jgi:hypothetical protein
MKGNKGKMDNQFHERLFRFRSFVNELLKERQVPEEKRDYVLNTIVGNSTRTYKPGTIGRFGTSLYSIQMAEHLKEELLRDATNFRLLLGIYFHDYRIFNYTVPELLVS